MYIFFPPSRVGDFLLMIIPTLSKDISTILLLHVSRSIRLLHYLLPKNSPKMGAEKRRFSTKPFSYNSYNLHSSQNIFWNIIVGVLQIRSKVWYFILGTNGGRKKFFYKIHFPRRVSIVESYFRIWVKVSCRHFHLGSQLAAEILKHPLSKTSFSSIYASSYWKWM